jgi:hypothetical protein
MTTVTLAFAATFITDPTTGLSVQLFKTDRAEQDVASVDVRIYAGGRRRIISTPARVRSSALTFQRVSAADVETLRAWRGRILLLRDFQGWRRFGTFIGIGASAIFRGPSAPPLYTVSLTWLDSDYSEAV